MSISSLANSAAARRPDFPPFDTVPQGVAEIAKAASTQPGSPAAAATGQPIPAQAAQNSAAVNTALNLLFGYIPVEILTLYVAILAAVKPPATTQQPVPVSRTEWIAFWSFLVATPIVVWLVYAAKVKAAQKPLPVFPRAWPVWEMSAATLAYTAWAFALPNTPFRLKDWYSSAIAGMAVLVASTILGLVAPLLQRPLPEQ